MRFKLDENIGVAGAAVLRDAGHDVCTVREQNLQGSSDETLFAACVRERRALVTLDHDFGQVLRFPPHHGPGIAVLELGPRPNLEKLLTWLRDFAAILAEMNLPSLMGLLWIVEPGRVRFHLSGKDDD